MVVENGTWKSRPCFDEKKSKLSRFSMHLINIFSFFFGFDRKLDVKNTLFCHAGIHCTVTRRKRWTLKFGRRTGEKNGWNLFSEQLFFFFVFPTFVGTETIVCNWINFKRTSNDKYGYCCLTTIGLDLPKSMPRNVHVVMEISRGKKKLKPQHYTPKRIEFE